MAKNQKSYTSKFKQQIVELYNAGGTSYPQLEREFGVNQSTISGWVKQLSPIRVSEEETITLKEYKALQKEIQCLKIENEILKKRPPYSQKNNSRDVCVPSNRRQEYEEFGRKVKQVYEVSKKRYGAVKYATY